MTPLENNYYSQTYILLELVKVMKDREVTFLDRTEDYKAIRGMWIKSLDYLKDKFFDMCHFYDKNYSIYISLARYKSIPPFSFNFSERSKETSKWFREDAKKEVFAYDMLFDFDYDNRFDIMEYIKELRNFFVLLQKENIKFYAIPSGRNFQFVIPSEIWGYDGLFNENNRNEKCERIIKQIKEKLNLKFLDTVGVGSLSKIMKCPYGLSNGLVCLPIVNCYFDNIEQFKIEFVMKYVTLKNRGIIYHNSDCAYIDFVLFCEKYNIEV